MNEQQSGADKGIDEQPNRDGLAAVAISLVAVLLIALVVSQTVF
jgi:hypothetical protein